MRLKIAVNACSLLTPMTGIGRYTYSLFSEIVKRDDCDVGFLYGTSWDKSLIVPAPQFQKTASVVKMLFPFARTVRRLIQGGVLRKKLTREKYDLYHEPNFFALSYAGPVISTIHDLSVIKYPEFHTLDRVKMFEKHLTRTIEKSEFLITDSEFVRQDIIEAFGVNPEKIVTTLLGVDNCFFPRGKEDVLSLLGRYKLEYNSFFLVVSTLEPRKNFKLVVDAYVRLDKNIKDRFPLVLVGMNGWEMSQFEDDLERLNRQGYLRMIGYVPNEDLPLLYSAAKLFIYPSFYEGFGLPPLESMACGTPVITSNVSSLPEVVGDAGFMVPPDDVVGLSEKILRLVEDDEAVEYLSKKALDRARLFTWERCADQTVDVYRRV
jgi:alpha-1,3-rhamnosyl/mannosyltransferase